MRPMLASRGASVPTGTGWIHEVKWDGMRVLVEIASGRVRLWSRNENDVTVSFPELHEPPSTDRDVLLDAEVVAFAEDGVPRFGALADRMHVGNAARAFTMPRHGQLQYTTWQQFRRGPKRRATACLTSRV